MQAFEIQRGSLIRRIYNINDGDFEGVALDVWRFQYQHNPVYHAFCTALGVSQDDVTKIGEIPFLPVVMFREHDIMTGVWEPEVIFQSSGTTGTIPGRHLIRDLSWYYRIADQAFTSCFGSPSKYTWLGLLPSYLERPDSSLVSMVHHFMQQSRQPFNAFYPQIDSQLIDALYDLARHQQAAILMGVSFALLDLFEQYQLPVWDGLLVIETGGMKGKREEITREELHARLSANHPGLRISSEYGMTELLSQAYLQSEAFHCAAAMKVYVRDISDPLRLIGPEQRGVINIIDLANLDTCSFIATDDIGILDVRRGFRVLGRLDQSDMRGCNLMYE